ncbi:hypothetical protein EC919_106101 [Pseudomonas graminis]|uniref:hypothetical protein n=1 Tax=Pseudomonas graminis TaxID=158627 RepID=UPI0010611BB0|nr:hypothetical protein [Pseudomonas graminis]TDV51224.1 hypothetical protein EC919_106101 [Pseudomonas graminis]
MYVFLNSHWIKPVLKEGVLICLNPSEPGVGGLMPPFFYRLGELVQLSAAKLPPRYFFKLTDVTELVREAVQWYVVV